MVTNVECKVYLKNKWPMNVIPLMDTGPIKDWWKKDKHLIDDIPQWHPDAWATSIGVSACQAQAVLVERLVYRHLLDHGPVQEPHYHGCRPKPTVLGSWSLLNNSLRFGITSSAKVSRDTILKPCQGKQIQDEARDMMVNILYTLRVFYTASS